MTFKKTDFEFPDGSIQQVEVWKVELMNRIMNMEFDQNTIDKFLPLNSTRDDLINELLSKFDQIFQLQP